jgi:hypothetical protein
MAETLKLGDDKIDWKEKKVRSPAGGFQPMIGAARVMAAAHAPRMDAVRMKRGIRSVYSLSGSDHSRRGSAAGGLGAW